MRIDKLTWVADYLHHPIAVSVIEKQVISTHIFNRLHNILQNSTVYLTYPSTRTSRFSHSLGCMHIAGDIFHCSIINAEERHRKRFLCAVRRELAKRDEDPWFRAKVEQHFSHSLDEAEIIQEQCEWMMDHPMYRSALSAVIAEEHRYAFLVAFQAVRLVALLHDLGHPPFSHVTESALWRIYSWLDSRRTTGEPLNKKQKAFLNLYDATLKGFDVFHEGLGRLLSSKVLTDVGAWFAGNDKMCYDMLVIGYLVLAILDGKSPLLEGLHKIVDSSLDADRLDFVDRDTGQSGLSRESIDLGRIVGSFKLVYNPSNGTTDPGDDSEPSFVPSVRALSTIESLLNRRLSLYKYVTFHHRVAKTDGLMETILVSLAKTYFSKGGVEEKLGAYDLPHEISGLWRVLDSSGLSFQRIRRNRYIQWDDAWLLSILRTEFFKLEQRRKSNKTEKTRLEVQLEELLTGRKHYFSLYKRADTFMVVDNAFLDALYGCHSASDITQFLKRKLGDRNPQGLRNVIDLVKAYWQARDRDPTGATTGFRARFGLFLSVLERVCRPALFSITELPFVDSAAQRLSRQFELDDVFVVPKYLKPGVETDTLLAAETGLVHLGEVSPIPELLERRTFYFPSFFVYVYKSSGLENADFDAMQRFFGKCLGQAFLQQ